MSFLSIIGLKVTDWGLAEIERIELFVSAEKFH